jgi:hypothetical protein
MGVPSGSLFSGLVQDRKRIGRRGPFDTCPAEQLVSLAIALSEC